MQVKELPKSQQLTPIWVEMYNATVGHVDNFQFKQVAARELNGEPKTLQLISDQGIAYISYKAYLDATVVEPKLDKFPSFDGTNDHFVNKAQA